MKSVSRAIVTAIVLGCTTFAASPASAAKFKTLHSFCNSTGGHACRDGGEGNGGGTLIADADGNLFGIAPAGGDRRGHGVIFEMERQAANKWKYHELYLFCHPRHCEDGALPVGSLVLDAAGTLYGTTSGGGINEGGTAYKLSPNADRTVWTLTTLYRFGAQSGDGINPEGLTYTGAASGVRYDGTSPLYGAAGNGGNSASSGTVFSLTPNGDQSAWTEQTIYSFCNGSQPPTCSDGNQPNGTPVFDSSGNIFGVTIGGGAGSGGGTVYELSLSGGTWTEQVLTSFCFNDSCPDGGTPTGPLAIDGAGNLYGATMQGSNSCVLGTCGVLFKLIPGSGWTYSVLYRFCSLSNCADGGFPNSGVTMDASGNLYGTTYLGGSHNSDLMHFGGGTVFKYGAGSLHTLYNFCAEADCEDGAYPAASLVRDVSGKLFGTTIGGGRSSHFYSGTVFELKP